MSADIVESLSRHAAESVTRRGSLLTLGGMLAAIVATPSLAEAKNNNGQSKRQRRKKAEKKAAEQAEQARQAEEARQAELARQAEEQVNQVCVNQVAGCRAHILSLCSNSQCVAVANCCESLGTCDATGFFTCFIEVVSDDD